MATSSTFAAPPLSEAPLISTGSVYRLAGAVALLALLTIAITIGGHWLGDRISLAGHTASTKAFDVTIGEDTLRLAANTIRFPSERQDGLAERVDLYLTWPKMQGYSEENRNIFNDVKQSASLIFLQVTQSVMSRDMSGRLEPIYSHVIDGAPFVGPNGLTAHRLRADAGYAGEVLLTAPRLGNSDYVVRCVLPPTSVQATSADCQRDIKVGKDLSVLYRFSSADLVDWDHLDDAVQRYVEARLLAAPSADEAAQQ